MDYKGPSKLTSEEELLGMAPIGRNLHLIFIQTERNKGDIEYMKKRNEGSSLNFS